MARRKPSRISTGRLQLLRLFSTLLPIAPTTGFFAHPPACYDTIRAMKISELETLRNWQATAVDNNTGHSIAIIRAGQREYHLYDGNSMGTPYPSLIEHPAGRTTHSFDEITEMFASRKLSLLNGFIPD